MERDTLDDRDEHFLELIDTDCDIDREMVIDTLWDTDCESELDIDRLELEIDCDTELDMELELEIDKL
jgi:hypothetical protein